MANTFTLAGNLKSAVGNAAREGEYVYIRLKSFGTDTEDDATYVNDNWSVGPSDASGDLPSTTVWINGDSGVSSVYEIRFENGSTAEVVIPSSVEGTTVNLEDILELYQTDSSTQQSTVYATAIDRTNHTGGPDDLNGNEIILDVDGDTSITADTDDQIDFKIGGSDVFSMTPTTGGYIASINQNLGTTSNVTFNQGTVGTLTGVEVLRTGDATNGGEMRGAANTLVASWGVGTSSFDISTRLRMGGTELQLDADHDTSITADTDDRIDIKVGGSDVARVDTEGLVTADVKALTSSGITIAASNGTTCATFGAGGGQNVTTADGLTVGGQLAITGNLDHNGSNIGFFGTTPTTKQTALTTGLTTLTFTAPGTPDYALQDVTNSSPYGFADAEEARTFISVVKNLQDRVNELETKLQAYGLLA